MPITKGRYKEMMKSEFIERTGFEPTLEEYREIEAEYMAAPEDVGKDTFCKQWKKRGGVERLMRLRARRIEELEAENASLYKEMSERQQDANAREQGLREQIKHLDETIQTDRTYYRKQTEHHGEHRKALEEQLNVANAKLEAIKKALAALQ